LVFTNRLYVLLNTYLGGFVEKFQARIAQDEYCAAEEFYYQVITPTNANSSFGSIYDQGIEVKLNIMIKKITLTQKQKDLIKKENLLMNKIEDTKMILGLILNFMCIQYFLGVYSSDLITYLFLFFTPLILLLLIFAYILIDVAAKYNLDLRPQYDHLKYQIEDLKSFLNKKSDK
jgi:hypothetical protein